MLYTRVLGNSEKEKVGLEIGRNALWKSQNVGRPLLEIRVSRLETALSHGPPAQWPAPSWPSFLLSLHPLSARVAWPCCQPASIAQKIFSPTLSALFSFLSYATPDFPNQRLSQVDKNPLKKSNTSNAAQAHQCKFAQSFLSQSLLLIASRHENFIFEN